MNTEALFCTHRSRCVVVVGECVQFVEQRLQHTSHLHVQGWLGLLPLLVVCCGRLTLLDVLLHKHDKSGQTVHRSKTTLSFLKVCYWQKFVWIDSFCGCKPLLQEKTTTLSELLTCVQSRCVFVPIYSFLHFYFFENLFCTYCYDSLTNCLYFLGLSKNLMLVVVFTFSQNMCRE